MDGVSQAALLGSVFQTVFEMDFDVQDPNQRIMMQKMVYLLMKMGVNCGDYQFYWDKFGPFSIDLCYDMRGKVETDGAFTFSDDGKKAMETLKEVFLESTVYPVHHWVEAIGSLEYLRDSVYPSANDDKLARKLVARKDYLDNQGENEKALKKVHELCPL